MVWVWKEEAGDEPSFDAGELQKSNHGSDDRYSTRKIVRSQCITEEVEPGKFVRKCEKTEEIFRDCLGKPSEVMQSNKEYTEEDVTDQVKKGLLPSDGPEIGHFDFPGLRSDIEAIERGLFGGLSRFLEAAEDMKNGFFGVFGSPHLYDDDFSSSSSRRQGIPIERSVPKEATPEPSDPGSGKIDFSGMARDV